MSRVSDLMGVLKGVKKIVGALQKHVERQTSDAWLHSSIREGIENASSSTKTAADLGKTFVDNIPQPILDARMKIDEAGEKLVCALESIKIMSDTGQVKIDKEERLHSMKETISELQERVESASSSVNELANHLSKGDLTSALNSLNDTINAFIPPAFEKDDIVRTEDIPGAGSSAEEVKCTKKDPKSSDLPDISKLINSIKNDIFNLDKTAMALQQTAKSVENELNVIIENFSIQAQSSGIINEQFPESMGDFKIDDVIDSTAMGSYPNPDNKSDQSSPQFNNKNLFHTIDVIKQELSELQMAAEELQRSTTFVKEDMTKILESISKGDIVSAAKVAISRVENETDFVNHDFSTDIDATASGFYPNVTNPYPIPDPVFEEDVPSSTSLEEEEAPEITQGNYTNPFPAKPFPVNGLPPTRNYSTLSQRPSIYQLYLRRLATSSKSIKPGEGPILKQSAESYLKDSDDYSSLSTYKYNISKKNQEVNSKKRKRIDTRAKRRAVPDTRFKRVFAFSGLAASLGWSTILEMSKRAVSGSDKKSILMREENLEIIVNKLCEVRGAALKIGQMLSMQEGAVLDPQFTEILRRVRDNADYMPEYQLNQQMTANIGENWLEKFKDFDQVPFAAASLGQVHYATLHDGTKAVVKVQYPGVATSINSDIDNFTRLLSVLNMIPKGVYIEQTMEVAKEELALETDYRREAKSQMEMRNFLLDDPDYDVPEVFLDLSGESVLTQKFATGEPVDTFTDAPEALRNSIGLKMLKLCLRELFEFRFMQTDPNWSNFFYDTETGKIQLLDFGASLNLTDEFTAEYLKVIRSCATGDRQTIIDSSIKMGFLTGYESEIMLNAHCDAIAVVGEPFSTNEDYDFVAKNASVRVGMLLAVFAKHRLTAPPRESYALNRKLSGAFLLCTKLKCVIPCKPLFDTVYNHRTAQET